MTVNASTTMFTIGGQHYEVPSSYLVLSLIASAAGILVTTLSLFNSSKGGIPFKSGWPVVGSWSFFTKRHRFIEDGLRRLGNIFTFNLLHHKVVVVAGEEARKTFFSNKDLDFTEGYRVLFGGTPSLKEIHIDREKEDGDMTWFGKRLTSVLRRDRLATTLPRMFHDLELRMEAWGVSGKFDPFEDIYNIVFQLTIRAASCREIADDPEAVERVMKLYWDMERGSTPSSVLLPWFPSRARSLKKRSTMDLYNILKNHIEDRKRTGRSEMDAMQVLLDEGDSTNDIVQFVMGTLFAGIINTGIMSSWMTLYLHENPTWKEKATTEVKAFIAKYATGDGSLAQQLAQVPPQVWDEEMPVLDLCLRETIRIVSTGSMLRRNVGDAVSFNGHKISPGTFVAMSIATVHQNPDIYPNPQTWDPDRYTREEDKKEHWAYVGWGVGRHPCLGMRFAKLEVKAILAMFLTRYEYELVDKSGTKVTTVPPPNRDLLYQVPPSKPVYVKYTRVAA